MAKILVLHGPNLNLLGSREPNTYGHTTFASICQSLVNSATEQRHELENFQSNGEQALIERIHKAAAQGISYIIINPAAFTHTSVAIRDALLAVAIPFIEVHLSNTLKREPFRHHSYFSDIAEGVIMGFGADSYRLALDVVLTRLAQH